MKTAVIYIRVSTPHQLPQRGSLSFPRQLDVCKAWCEDHDVRIVGVITECGSASSGSHVDRKRDKRGKCSQLGRFLNKLEDGFDVDYLVFEDWDRFSKLPYFETCTIKSDFEDFGVDLISTGICYSDKITNITDEEKYIMNNLGYHEVQ